MVGGFQEVFDGPVAVVGLGPGLAGELEFNEWGEEGVALVIGFEVG